MSLCAANTPACWLLHRLRKDRLLLPTRTALGHSGFDLIDLDLAAPVEKAIYLKTPTCAARNVGGRYCIFHIPTLEFEEWVGLTQDIRDWPDFFRDWPDSLYQSGYWV